MFQGITDWIKEIDIEKFFEDRSNGSDMNDSEGSNVKISPLLLLFSKTNNVYMYIYNLHLRLINGGIGFNKSFLSCISLHVKVMNWYILLILL